MTAARATPQVTGPDEYSAPTSQGPARHRSHVTQQSLEEVDLSYPIILGPDGRVMDGMHRVARAILEGRRLAAAEESFDPATFRHLDTIGIATVCDASRSAVAAGPVARFMAERVGSTGWVLVTDIHVDKLAAMA
jgi:hypothetical protein